MQDILLTTLPELKEDVDYYYDDDIMIIIDKALDKHMKKINDKIKEYIGQEKIKEEFNSKSKELLYHENIKQENPLN